MGPDFGLRIDPNGVWSVPTAIRIGQRLEAVGMEYFEDPAWGLEGNAKAIARPL
ncbi:enolase C-terminal domain-like protein [Bosea sp. Root483D1]|uniref:enolase C-terminal domain-like protein n=1 Tax=Bosea sp. Root483D1 TaxID=1736544 RepID=UPI0039B8AD90